MAERGDLHPVVGGPGLGHRGQQVDPLLGPLPGGLVGSVAGDVDGLGVEVQQGPHGLDLGLHGEEHAPHVGVLDDERLLPRVGPGRPALAALRGEGPGLLVGPLGQRQPLHAHGQPGVVHHREHGPHAAVLRPDELAHRVLVAEHAGGAGLDAHLVLDRHAPDAVALPEGAVVAHEVLGHDEAGDAPRAGGGPRGAGQHQVDDVLGQVVLAEADVDLGAGDAVGAVVVGDGPGPQGPDVGAGLRLGEVHRAAPLAAHQLAEVALLLGLGPVGGEHLDGALRQHRAHRERHVGRRQHLLEGESHDPREPATAVVGVEAHAGPARLHQPAVGLGEAGRGADVAVGVEVDALHVTGAVGRGHHLGHEPAGLLHHPGHGRRVGVGEDGQLGQRLEVDQVVEHEVDVAQRGLVGRHAAQRRDALRSGLGYGRTS